jgi:hypothetical protein
MEVYATDFSLHLVEADIVEAFETSTSDCSDTVIWDQEVFLPSHKDILSLSKLWYE